MFGRKSLSVSRSRYAVVTGSSKLYENNIEWWLNCLREENKDIPIIFYDFGLSDRGKRYLESAPNCQLVTGIFDTQKFEWSFKQRACIDSSKYAEKILWLDQDCEVFGCLEPIFLKVNHFLEFVISRDLPQLRYPNDPYLYFNQRQAGVFCCFSKNPILGFWASSKDSYLNDQVAISAILDQKILGVKEVVLDPQYHWPRLFVQHYLDNKFSSPTIIHWTGEEGLKIIELRKAEKQKEMSL